MTSTRDVEEALRRAREARAPGAPVGDVPDFLIDVDGRWIHQGRLISRPALVALFATVLRREDDGHYLVTPVERVRVEVEDAAFVVTLAHIDEDGGAIELETNVGWRRALGPDRILRPKRRADGSIIPYLPLERGLEARLQRNVYYELAERAEEGPDGALGLWAGGVFHPLDLEEPPRAAQEGS